MNEIYRNVLLGIMLAAPIGPAGVAVIQSGLRWGFRRAFPTGLGITTADLTYMLLVYFGLSGFVSIPFVKILIWSLGALVLFYLGAQSLRDGGRKLDLETSSMNFSKNPYLVGYMVNISNPLAVVFWLGIFGSLISVAPGTDQGIGALTRGLSILFGILAWHTTVSILTHWGKRFVNEKTARVISIVAGAVLLLFGLRFAYNVVASIISL
jgi:threonine/homoserine/homoserine lactone efflux protein